MKFTTEDLKAFVATVSAGSMGAAARQAGITQPAIAQHVRRLEQQLEMPLLIRSSQGIKPTEAGEILFRRATVALQSMDAAVREIQDAAGRSQSPILSFSASLGTINALFKSALHGVRKQYPAMQLNLELGLTRQARIAAVLQRRVDFTCIPQDPAMTVLEQRQLIDMPLLLLVNCQHSLANKRSVNVRDLTSIRYIGLHQSSTYAFVQSQLDRLNLSFSITDTVATAESAILMVELGLGETLLPAMHLPQVRRNKMLRAIPIQSLDPVPLAWAAMHFDSLPTIATTFMAMVSKRLSVSFKRSFKYIM